MPNHVKNRLKIIGTNEQIEEVFEKYNTHIEAKLCTSYDGNVVCKNLDDEYKFGWLNLQTGDFHTRESGSKRIGLPDNWTLEITQPRDMFPDFDKIIPHPRCDEYNDIPNQDIASTSPNWWMTWNRNNWGTKWNSYCHEVIEFGTYTFETAWSGVVELILEMSEQNPNIHFEYTYSDEDTGYNVGKYTFLNGNIIEEYIPEGGSKEAYDIYFELRPDERDEYDFVDGEYVYKEEEEYGNK